MYEDNMPRRVDTGVRLGSMAIDFVFTFIICAVPLRFIALIDLFTRHGRPSEHILPFSGNVVFLFAALFALYFCKDCIMGRSPAKLILKLQVVDNKTGQPASPLQCLVRNLLFIIWPVEFIVALINPSRRIGDQLAGTRLVMYAPAEEAAPLRAWQWPIAYILAYGFALGLLWPVKMMVHQMKEMVKDNAGAMTSLSSEKYREADENLQKMLQDSLTDIKTITVHSYDLSANSNHRYITVVIVLDNNLLAESETEAYSRFKIKTLKLLKAACVQDECTGSVTCTYLSGFHFKSDNFDF